MEKLDFETFEKMVKRKNLEEVVRSYDWKYFENVIANIFERNGFRIRKNFRFKTSHRFEIDVLAISDLYVFCVDCKDWGKGRYKKTGLKKAVKNQEERTKQLTKFLKKNIIAKQILKIEMKKQKFYSLIVTVFEEDLLKEGDTFVVPAWKLNSFLLNIEKFL